MKLTHTQLDLALAYVKNELKEETLTDFEAALATNEALREEVAFQRDLLSAVRLNVVTKNIEQASLDNILEDKTLNPQFQTIQNHIEQARADTINWQKQRTRIHRIRGLAAAACIVLASIFGLKMYLNHQLDNDMEQLAATVKHGHISLTENIKDVSARRTVIIEQLDVATQAFDKGDWETTQQIFKYLRGILLYNSAEMDFYESIIFYHKKEYEKSIEKLESINLDEAESTCQIHHFLALSYLKIKDKTQAKEQYEVFTKNSQQCDKQAVRRLKKYFVLAL